MGGQLAMPKPANTKVDDATTKVDDATTKQNGKKKKGGKKVAVKKAPKK
jgi:hypothetical protein